MKKLFVLWMGMCLGNSSIAQFNELSNVLNGGVADASELMGAYVDPFSQTFAANLNSGWVNSGNPLKLGRFQFKLVLPISFIPESMKSFDLSELDLAQPRSYTLNGVSITESWSFSQNTTQTVFGSNDDASATLTKKILYIDPNTNMPVENTLAEFTMPQGTGFGVNFVPPALQFTLGIGLGTQVMARYTPPYTGQTARFTSWGFGLMHDFTESLPGFKSLPFNISAAFSITNLSGNYFFDKPIAFVPPGGYANPSLSGTSYQGLLFDPANFNNQSFGISSTGSNLSVLISRRLPFFTPYGGFRLLSAFTQIGFDGEYAFAEELYFNPNNQNDPNNGKFALKVIESPINVENELYLMGVFAGLRFKLGLITIFAEYNYARFNTLSVGAGIGFFN